MSSQDTRERLPTLPNAGFRPGQQNAERADSSGQAHHHHEHRLERLIDRLPERWQRGIRWLRQPSARWARIPAGVLLVLGGFLAILPVFGLWMIPLGLILLAEDVPPLRRLRERGLEWAERRWPNLFGGQRKQSSDKEETT